VFDEPGAAAPRGPESGRGPSASVTLACADRGDVGEGDDDGLLDPAALAAGRAVLTRRGRLLADRVVHRLLAGASV
jgi:hypothetical protein